MRSARARRSSTPGPLFVLTADLIVLISSCLGRTTLAEYGIAKRSQLAAAHQPEALVGGDDPGFFRRQRVFLSKLLEDRRRDRRLAAVRVDVLPAAGDQRARGVEVSGEPFVARDRVDESLRHELRREVRDVDPSLRSQRVLVADAAAERHDNHAAFRFPAGRGFSVRRGRAAATSRPCTPPSCGARSRRRSAALGSSVRGLTGGMRRQLTAVLAGAARQDIRAARDAPAACVESRRCLRE